ncbi:MAG: outer membrane lipoprotein carrier protein LolA [Pyrinomonadaceae bacterium]|nr:outer membrane lipoprotein carrier protein LolA [Pyrinomonadaceae bacterium]MCX7639677.1 outer membrane lipoprotein carrier protein LolA [Pyrinomonadaceae bacterium]MDW8304579.1 outer membrane lipoprotein carrier protein LolA [Acidobacteriota bacterium]
MKVKWLYSLTLILLFAFEASGQLLLNEILKRMDQHHKALTSLQASVTMEKYNAQLDERDIFEGVVKYLPKTGRRSMYVRLDWTKPVVEQIAIIGNAYTLYRPRLNQVYVGKTDEAKNNAKVGNALAFMNMSRQELKENYTVNYLGKEKIRDGVETWYLELIPKRSSSYRAAYLWVDVDGMPRQARVVENNGDTTTIFLYNIQKNVTLRGSDFEIKYPSNIKPIRG